MKIAEIEWTEYERGWGQRPDVFSYHSTLDDAEKYAKEFIDGLPGTAPDCYSSPGTPRIVEVEDTFGFLVVGKGIVWTSNSVINE